MDGHLRPLSWAIGRKDSQASDIHSIKMMIGITEKFSGPFGGSIRGYRLDIEVLFRKGDPLVFPIDRRGGGKNEVFDPMLFTSFQKNIRSADIHILIEERIGDRGSYSGPGSQVDDK